MPLAEQTAQNSVDPVRKAEQPAQSKCRAHLCQGIVHQVRNARHGREAAADAAYGWLRHIWTTSKRDWVGVVGCRVPSLLGRWELKGQARPIPAHRALLLFRAAAGSAGNRSRAAQLLVPLPAAADEERVRLGSF